jgi:hypothetical protein
MFEIADLFCSYKTNTRYIFRTETFYHLKFGLTPGEACFHHDDEQKSVENNTRGGHREYSF